MAAIDCSGIAGRYQISLNKLKEVQYTFEIRPSKENIKVRIAPTEISVGSFKELYILKFNGLGGKNSVLLKPFTIVVNRGGMETSFPEDSRIHQKHLQRMIFLIEKKMNASAADSYDLITLAALLPELKSLDTLFKEKKECAEQEKKKREEIERKKLLQK